MLTAAPPHALVEMTTDRWAPSVAPPEAMAGLACLLHAPADAAITDPGRLDVQKWEYMVVPLEPAGKLKKQATGMSPGHLNDLGAEGWEAVGLTLKRGDLVAWPIVLLKRPVS